MLLLGTCRAAHRRPAQVRHQSPLAPHEVYRAGIAAVDGHCRRLFDNKSFAEFPATNQGAVLTDLEKGVLEFDNASDKLLAVIQPCVLFAYLAMKLSRKDFWNG